MKNNTKKIFSVFIFVTLFLILVGVGRVEAYTVTFNGNYSTGGSTPTQTINQGSTTPLTLNGYTKTGNIFTGWATTTGGPVVYTDGASYTMGSSSVTLRASWLPFYTVTFNVNNGTGTPATQNINSGVTANLRTNTYTRTNYTFAGWNTAANGTGTSYADAASYTMGTSGVILYAKWNAIPHTITFNANGGVGNMATQTINQAASTTLPLNSFTRANYIFAGWATSTTGVVAYADRATYIMGASDVTFYAKWTATCTYTQSVNTWSSCSVGMRYATDVTFATSTAGSAACLNIPTVQACSQDIEGNDFGIINIGTQTWMADNLKTTKYNNGSAIGGNMTWYNNDSNNKNTYGGLYNYLAANNSMICPSGWHVPVENDWAILRTFTGGDALSPNGTGYVFPTAGVKLKTIARGGTNDYGFSALGGGKHDNDTGSWAFTSLSSSYWWVANSHYFLSGKDIRYYPADGYGYTSGKSINDSISTDSLYFQYPRDLWVAMSVRCIKDTPYVPPTQTCYDSSVAPTPKPLRDVLGLTDSTLDTYLKLDDNFTNNGNGFSGSTRTYAKYGAGTAAYTTGVNVSGATSFNNAYFPNSNNYISSSGGANDFGVNVPNAGTVSMWIKTSSANSGATNSPRIFGASNHFECFLPWGLNSVQCDLGTGATLSSLGNLEVGKWYHLVVTWDTTAHKQQLWINGEVVSTATATVKPTAGTDMWIGKSHSINDLGSINGQPFNGAIDDVAFYRRALSTCEVKSLYMGVNACLPDCNTTACYDPATSVPIPAVQTLGASSLAYNTYGYYPLTDLTNSGSAAYPNGTATNVTAITTGKFGGAQSFSGSDSRMKLGTSDTILQTSGPKTFSLWIKPAGGDAGNIFSKYRTDTLEGGYHFQIDANNQVKLTIKNSASTGFSTSQSQPLSTTTWTHLAVTMDTANKTIALYVNGDLVGSKNTSLTGTFTNATAAFIMGAEWYGGNSYVTPYNQLTDTLCNWADCFYKGSVDDFFVVDKVLTDCEIKKLAKGPNACGEACNDFNTTCSVNPAATTTIDQLVTWTATSTGGTGNYIYSWVGDEFVNGKATSTFSGYYSTSTPSQKQATVTVSDGLATTTINCVGTVSGSVGTTTIGGCVVDCGVTIVAPTVNGSCVIGGTYMAAPTNPYLCLTGTSTVVLGGVDGPWSWSCLGSGPSHTDATNCSATKLSPLDSNLTCTLTAASSTANVNTSTFWTVTSPNSFTRARWSNGVNTPVIQVGNTFSNIFTTIGLKTMTAEIASTTDYVFGAPCTATTTIVQTGGNLREI